MHPHCNNLKQMHLIFLYLKIIKWSILEKRIFALDYFLFNQFFKIKFSLHKVTMFCKCKVTFLNRFLEYLKCFGIYLSQTSQHSKEILQGSSQFVGSHVYSFDLSHKRSKWKNVVHYTEEGSLYIPGIGNWRKIWNY